MNLDTLIKAERDAPAEATREQSREVWGSIERSIVGAPLLAPLAAGKLSTLTKFGATLSTTTGKVVLATAIVAGGTAGALSIPPPPPSEASERAPKAAPETAPKASPRAAPKSASLAPTPAAAPTPPEPVADDAVPIQRPKSVEPQRPKTAAPPTSEVASAEEQPEAPLDDAGLEHGLLLVKRAEKALKKGNYDVALAFLRRHRKLYPDSPLVEHREALFVQSLCSGDHSLAAKARWDFNRRWPESRYREHLRTLCLEPKTDPQPH